MHPCALRRWRLHASQHPEGMAAMAAELPQASTARVGAHPIASSIKGEVCLLSEAPVAGERRHRRALGGCWPELRARADRAWPARRRCGASAVDAARRQQWAVADGHEGHIEDHPGSLCARRAMGSDGAAGDRPRTHGVRRTRRKREKILPALKRPIATRCRRSRVPALHHGRTALATGPREAG